jgi:MFS family permease
MKIYKNLRILFYINSFLGTQIYMAPILTLFYLNHLGLSFKEFAFFEVFVFSLITFLEIPSGAISDSIGKKKAIIISDIIIVAGMLLITLLPSMTSIYLAAILFPVGFSLKSGNLHAATYEILKNENMEDKYLDIMSKSSGISLFMFVFASFIGGYLAGIDIRIPVFIDIACNILSSIAVFYLLKNIDDKKDNKRLIEVIKNGHKTILNALKQVRSNSRLLATISICSLLGAYVRSSFLTYQPILEGMKFSKFEIGIVFSLFGVIGGIFSFSTKKISSLLGNKNHMEYLFIFMIFLCALTSYFNVYYLIVITMFIHQIIRGLGGPFFSNSINKMIKENNSRVTVLSITNFLSALFCAFYITIIGKMVDLYDYQKSLFLVSIIAIFMIILGVIIITLEKKREV